MQLIHKAQQDKGVNLMHIVTIANQKGGTGKTTTAAALLQAGKTKGLNVLAIDLDPQANLTYTLKADANLKGSYELIQGLPPQQLIQQTKQGIDTIAASRNLATLTTTTGSANRLQKALQPIKGIYDLIVIDTPPTAGELQYNALQASTGLIIPLQADIYNLQGLYQMADTARRIQRSNRNLIINGFILTRHDNRSNLARQMKKTITAKAAEMHINYLSTIREGIAIKEAAAFQENLFEYAPNSKPAQDYMQLYKMIMEDKNNG